MARRVPLVGLAVGFLVAFFVFSQKGHRRAKIREHRCKQQMPLMGMARNYDDQGQSGISGILAVSDLQSHHRAGGNHPF